MYPHHCGTGQDILGQAQDVQRLCQGHGHKEPGHSLGGRNREASGERRAESLPPSHPPLGVLLAGAGPKGLERLEESRYVNRSWHPSSNSLQRAGPASYPPMERAPGRCRACRDISEHGDGTAAKPVSHSPVCSCRNNGLQGLTSTGSSVLGPSRAPHHAHRGLTV